MSLRVLLADESASIRKVFQMGLQDYGADVKSVHNGLDVLEVAEKYEPHIVFADILLQKKSGYEVSSEMGQHEALKDVPVILMWSSFMELDHKRYESCGALGELEKPFDVEAMRKLIQNLVDLAKTQQISEFLEFPDTIAKSFVENENPPTPTESLSASTDSTELIADDEDDDTSSFVIEGEDSLDLRDDSETETQTDYMVAENSSVFNVQTEDAAFDISALEKVAPPTKTQEDVLEISESGDWKATPLTDQTFQPLEQPKASDQEMDQFQSMNLQSESKMNLDDFLYKPEENLTPPPKPDIETTQHTSTPTSPTTSAKTLSSEEVEHIVRQETRLFLQSMVSKELPALLERIVRDELKLILSEEVALKTTNPNP